MWNQGRQDATGQVRDPLTGRFMSKNEPWDMGHQSGLELRKMQRSAFEQDMSHEQWLDWQNDPSHYRPELASSNRSHLAEDLSNDYFGP